MLTERLLKRLIDGINNLNGGSIIGVKLPSGWKYPEKAQNYVVVKSQPPRIRNARLDFR